MVLFAQLRDLDSAGWRAATWTVPFAAQVEFAAMVGVAWLIGKRLHETVALFVISATLTALATAVTVRLLLRSPAPRARGAAAGILGAFLVVFISALVFGFWILRW
jgi:hypothetical protein